MKEQSDHAGSILFAILSGSDCLEQSSLIRIFTVCHFVCFLWIHDCILKPYFSNFRIITAIFLGVRIFRLSTVPLICPYFSDTIPLSPALLILVSVGRYKLP